MAYVILALAIVQLILASYNFCKVPKTLTGFFITYANFCTMFFTFLTAFIMLSK
jgi:hypothetical protein